jgi:hypothetical protein
MNDLDLVLPEKIRYFQRAENSERVPDRHMKDLFRRQERQPMPPVAPRPKCHENIVSPGVETAAKINDMSLGTAEVSCG